MSKKDIEKILYENQVLQSICINKIVIKFDTYEIKDNYISFYKRDWLTGYVNMDNIEDIR